MRKQKQEIIERLNFEAYYKREVPSLKVYGSGKAMGLCPFHDDHKPSLSVNFDTGDYVCYGCGAKGSIFDYHMKKYNVSFKEALISLAKEAGLEPESKSKTIVAIYDYTDEEGNLLFQVVRYEPKDFRQRRPDGKDGWIYNLKGVRLVPYRLPEVLSADRVFVIEGEKDVDRLRDLGLTATCNPMGAGKWREDFNQYFRDKTVIILPDNDEAGRKHAEKVANGLSGIAKIVKVLELPGLPEKGDVSDWLKTGGTKEDLLNLADEAKEWEPKADGRAILVHLSDIETQPVSWLWKGYLPIGKITLLDGDPGTGKSTICYDLASRISSGEPMPDGQEGMQGGVVIITGEDGLQDTVKPRIEVAGGDTSKIVALRGVRTDEGVSGFMLSDFIALEEAMKSVGARLVIVDPLMAFLPAGVNSWSDQSVRSVLTPLANFADEMGVCILVVRHLSKHGISHALYRGGGSIGIIGIARVGLLAGVDPENENSRILACVKNNLAPKPPSLKYEMEPVGDYFRIRWVGVSEKTANDILVLSNENQSAIDEAKEFLKDILSNGPVKASDVFKQGREIGLSEKTIKRAKKMLEITSLKLDFSSGWVWQFPLEEGQKIPKGDNKNIDPLREKMTPFDENDRKTPDVFQGGNGDKTPPDNGGNCNHKPPEVIDLSDTDFEVLDV